MLINKSVISVSANDGLIVGNQEFDLHLGEQKRIDDVLIKRYDDRYVIKFDQGDPFGDKLVIRPKIGNFAGQEESVNFLDSNLFADGSNGKYRGLLGNNNGNSRDDLFNRDRDLLDDGVISARDNRIISHTFAQRFRV